MQSHGFPHKEVDLSAHCQVLRLFAATKRGGKMYLMKGRINPLKSRWPKGYCRSIGRTCDSWYVGAMTGSGPGTLTLDCSFLPDGAYAIGLIQDGLDADRNAHGHKKTDDSITRGSKIILKLAPGGGWAAIIKKENDQ